MPDVGVGEAEHVDRLEARVVRDLPRGVHGQDPSAVLGSREESAELDPSVVPPARVPEAPVGDQRRELERKGAENRRGGQPPMAFGRPARDDREAQRHQHEEEALAKDIPPDVDPEDQPARRERRLERPPAPADRDHRRRAEDQEVRQHPRGKGEVGELAQGVGDAAGQRPRDLGVVGVRQRVAVVREPEGDQRCHRRRGRHRGRSRPRPVATQGQENDRDSRGHESVGAREHQEDEDRDQRPRPALFTGDLRPEDHL